MKFPYRLLAEIFRRIAQIIFSIFFLILHPGFKGLVHLLTRSAFVRHYIRPALQRIGARLFDPYFAFLAGLPPYWATFSIALPLAFLEPAKLYATILIVEHPKTGIGLWLFLHGLSFVLIEKSWTAVRPQSRKIWLISRLHAWGWLNLEYGKYWIRTSLFYRTVVRWRKQVWAAAQEFWGRLTASSRSRPRLPGVPAKAPGRPPPKIAPKPKHHAQDLKRLKRSRVKAARRQRRRS